MKPAGSLRLFAWNNRHQRFFDWFSNVFFFKELKPKQFSDSELYLFKEEPQLVWFLGNSKKHMTHNIGVNLTQYGR
jgi:hypothetical protein